MTTEPGELLKIEGVSVNGAAEGFPGAAPLAKLSYKRADGKYEVLVPVILPADRVHVLTPKEIREMAGYP